MLSVNQLALRTSLPVLFGYLPLGAAFGVLFAELGHHWLYATAMGLFIYAGAGQFLAVGLLANQAALTEMVIATLLLNARHLFYGLSLLNRIRSRGWRRWYQIFSLTDETYSLLSSTRAPQGIDEGQLQLRIAAFNQIYWVLGCTLGAFIGSQVSFSTAGIEFVLPALFMVLAIEQYHSIREPWPFWLALSIGLGTLLLISREHMLLIAILLSLCVLLLQRAGRS
ncbi:branched-chain amino acid ABC transporter permease [Bacterioplanes sanyensis]|uniref:AzlC family ABC transporter permease n=1 Tax=Bacterioplanes sanyensis TaxID=1249553 RepID=UPI001671BB6E|nr:AzlC family ABC transporter permease [Bacterioplanes sanyensis]GGY55746.1 branched-chain amino acid ABC transporter permease [Bacterioplanes sanyensis]